MQHKITNQRFSAQFAGGDMPLFMLNITPDILCNIV